MQQSVTFTEIWHVMWFLQVQWLDITHTKGLADWHTNINKYLHHRLCVHVWYLYYSESINRNSVNKQNIHTHKHTHTPNNQRKLTLKRVSWNKNEWYPPPFFKTTPLFYHPLPFWGKIWPPPLFFRKFRKLDPSSSFIKVRGFQLWYEVALSVNEHDLISNSRLLEKAKFLTTAVSPLNPAFLHCTKKLAKRYIHLTDLHFPDFINNKNVKKASVTWQFVFCYCPLMWTFYCRILKIKLIRFRREP